MSRNERTRSSTRRRARSASLSRSTPTTTDTSSNAIIITRERRNKLREKDVSDDSALSPDITDSDTRNRFQCSGVGTKTGVSFLTQQKFRVLITGVVRLVANFFFQLKVGMRKLIVIRLFFYKQPAKTFENKFINNVKQPTFVQITTRKYSRKDTKTIISKKLRAAEKLGNFNPNPSNRYRQCYYF